MINNELGENSTPEFTIGSRVRTRGAQSREGTIVGINEGTSIINIDHGGTLTVGRSFQVKWDDGEVGPALRKSDIKLI